MVNSIINKCPVCSTIGNLVKNITVQHMVNIELKEDVGSNNYFLCMNKDCDITYFNIDINKKFNIHQVTKPIWFKKDASPRYACYCSEITEANVYDAVLNKNASSIEDIIKITGAMNNSQCQKKNPLGRCCDQIIQETINKALSFK